MFRAGLIQWFVLSAWCILTSTATTNLTDSKHVWKWNSTDDTCRPVICSCYMDGVYYDEGEEWQDPEDPCVRYRCLQNGFYKPVRSGCSFKGTCKNHNETWTEGCFTYHCSADKNSWRYTLVQPGCATKKGDCLQVGERYMELCDTYECQIVGSCYTLTKVKSGCQSKKDGCKPVYSFWHDECALYQCTLDKGKSESIIQTHSHDVMVWPRGEYAMLETVHDCPPVFSEFWKEGYHAHWGEGQNDYSDDYDLKGNTTKLMMEHYFCVHRELNDTTLLPVYQTYWEDGAYCILAYNGSCPKDFKEGMVLMGDVLKNETNHTWGTLPDGYFNDLDTGMLFCCRDDGDIKKPIVLPTRHPFALFMAANESDCQEVRGMDHRIEYFSHDDINNGTRREMHGSLPAVKTADNNTLIYVCYYTPVACGCVDTDGDFLAVDDVIEKACVKYQCKEENDLKILVVIQGGCDVEGKLECVGENETWVETEGEGCYTKQCVRHVDNKTGQITFEVETILKECRDGDQCRPLTFTKTHGCYSTHCQENNITGEVSFAVTEAGCSDGYGHCVEVGKTVKKQCVELKCNLEISKCGLVPIKGGCFFNDHCYDEGSTWTYACSNFTCINNSNKTHYKWKSQAVSKGCLDHKEKCHREGDQITKKCVTYQCMWEDIPGFYALSGGCLWRGKCYDANTKWKDNCSVYNCTVVQNGTHTIRRVLPVHLGCKIGTKCVNYGATYEKSCVTYSCQKTDEECGIKVERVDCIHPKTDQCVAANATIRKKCGTYRCKVTKTGKKYSRGFTPITIGCYYKSKCYHENDTMDKDCLTYKCFEEKLQSGAVRSGFRVSSYRCTNLNTSKCMENNATFEYYCGTYRCHITQTDKGYIRQLKPVIIGCSWRGKCRTANTTWQEGCSTYNCTVTINGTHANRRVNPVHLGCKIDNKCVTSGDTYEKKCVTYKCQRGGKECGTKIVKIGCVHPTTSNCIEANATINKQCRTYKCKITKTGNRYARVLQPVTAGCLYNKTCYGENKTVVINCQTYKCRQITLQSGTTRIGFHLDSSGCSYKGACHKENETFMEGCLQKVCYTYHNGSKVFFNIVPMNCKREGKCYNINETQKVNCITYKCLEKDNSFYKRASMVTTEIGCGDKGVCRKLDEEYSDGCSTKVCRKEKLKSGSYQLKIVTKGGKKCKKYGKCYGLGETLKVKLEKYCRIYSCQSNGNFYPTKLTCKSLNGTCIEAGSTETFEKHMSNNKYLCKCICKQSRHNGPYSFCPSCTLL